MELPKGKANTNLSLNIKISTVIPENTAALVHDKAVVGAITNVKCPVVENVRKRKSRGPGVRTLLRPEPPKIHGVAYSPNVDLAKLEKFWCLSAIDYCKGSIPAAARLLGVSRETLYRKVREYNG